MYRFQRRLNDLELPGVGLKLVDFNTLPPRRRQRLEEEFNVEFDEGFMVDTFPTIRLCRSMECINPLLRAYVLDRSEKIANGTPIESVEDWSRHSGAQHAKGYVHLPHEGLRWFEIRALATDRTVGVMQISKINLLRIENRTAYLCGHALMTLPSRPRLTFGELWGEVLKEMLDTPFELRRNPNRKVVFEEWVLHDDPEVRFIPREGFTFGPDVMRHLGAGTIVETEDSQKEFAPRNVRKRVRPPRLTEDELRLGREEVNSEDDEAVVTIVVDQTGIVG